MRRVLGFALLLAVAVALLVAITACGSSDNGTDNGTTGNGNTDGSADGAAVTIADFAFSPQSVQIAVGESVTWTNEDSAAHTVDGDGGIASGNLSQGDTYTQGFDTAGTYTYVCSIHPSMTGTVVVK